MHRKGVSGRVSLLPCNIAINAAMYVKTMSPHFLCLINFCLMSENILDRREEPNPIHIHGLAGFKNWLERILCITSKWPTICLQ